MAEVPEYLVPTDGLTNSNIHLEGIDLTEGGGADFRFTITDEKQKYVSTYTIYVPAQNASMDHMLAEAHRQLRDTLRQWLHGVEMMRQVYAERANGWTRSGKE